MNKKHLFLVNNLEVGGAEVSLINLVNHLAEQEKQITVVTLMNTTNETLENRLNNKIKLINMNFNPVMVKLMSIFLPKMLIKKIKKNLEPLLNYQTVTAGLELYPTYILNKINHPKKIYQVHSNLQLIVQKGNKVIQKMLNKLNSSYPLNATYMCVSDTVKQVFLNLNPQIDPKRVKVVDNLINYKLILELAEQKIPKNIDIQDNYFLTIARLVPEKRLDRVVKIAKIMPNEKFYIIGEGPERKKIEKLIEEEKVKNVTLLGNQKNPYPFLKKAKKLLLTSQTEGAPVVIIEATILNIPFVATNVANIESIAKKYQNGVVINQKDNYAEFKKVLNNSNLQTKPNYHDINNQTYDKIKKIYLENIKMEDI